MSKPTNIRAGSVQLSSFENEVKGKDKKTFISTSVKLSKSYKDKDGNWQNTDSFKPGELLNVLIVIQEFLRDYYLKTQNQEKEEEVSLPD